MWRVVFLEWCYAITMTKSLEIDARLNARIAILNGRPRTKCHVCQTTQRYMNPMARCFECKKKFCYDHILGGMVCPSMKENEEVRNICESCKVGYHSLVNP